MPWTSRRNSFARVAFRSPIGVRRVVTVELVEGAEDHVVAAPTPQQIEHRKAVGVANDGLAVDQTTAPAASDRRCGQREAIGKVIAVAGVKPDTAVVALVNPVRSGRRLRWRRHGPMRRRCNSRDADIRPLDRIGSGVDGSIRASRGFP
jgi:hypothetical protein